MNSVSRALIRLLVPCVASAQLAHADTIDETPRTVLDVRVYQNGDLVIRIAPATTATCQYPDTLELSATSPAYNLASRLALTAYTSRGQIPILFLWNNSCISGAPDENVQITGLALFPWRGY